MRKIFLPLLICALTANTATAKTTWDTGKRTECFRSIEGSKQSTVQYYFCGEQTKSCNGLFYSKLFHKKSPLWYYETDGEKGKYVEKDGTKWWCCGGTKEREGTFKANNQWLINEDVTIDVGGGTCTYQRTTTVCGTVKSDNKCTVPTECPQGKTLRNNECAATCRRGRGYASATSNNCVDCSGDDRGVNALGICMVCESGQKWNGKVCEDAAVAPSAPDEATPAPVEAPSVPDEATPAPVEATPATDEATSAGCKSTEYMSPVSGKCVNKSKSAQYSRDMMYECYGCSTDVRFKNCLNIYRAAPSTKALTSAQKGTLKACNITEDQYTEAVGGRLKKTPVFVNLNLNSDVISKKLADAFKGVKVPTELAASKEKFNSAPAASQMTMM